MTTATLTGGVTTTSLTLDVGSNAGIGGTPGGSLSLSPGTTVTLVTGAPVGNLGAASMNLFGAPGVSTPDVGLLDISPYTGTTTLDFGSLFGSGGTTFNFFS